MRVKADANVAEDLDRFIAAFEAARYDGKKYEDRQADLAKFLPDRNDPHYLEVLRELVRVDLEFAWSDGQTRRLDDYRRRFPELFHDFESVQAVCFEEFRLRQQAGENVSTDEYQKSYGVDTQSWTMLALGGDANAARGDGLNSPSWPSLLADAPIAESNGHASPSVPELGDTVAGFEIVGELGRGAFATVFLARQASLADRYVALKISRMQIEESNYLACLQHTNIVPIYSVHRHGPFQVICMPFYGSTTLADLIRELAGQHTLPASGKALVETLCLREGVTRWKYQNAPWAADVSFVLAREVPDRPANAPAIENSHAASCLKALSGLTYVEAGLWIGCRLAAGLHHAHQRGILHRDLKPANVLLADDGQPMLLDFNLSENLQSGPAAAAEFTGGTLPYMAPENLLAYQSGLRGGDTRSDIYSLGVILYELLTGRQPFPARPGSPDEVLPRMLADRQGSPPALRRWNKAVSPAAEAIVQKCLSASPQHRYASADELRDDLQRQLKHQPLRYAPEPSLRERAGKWVRRHPRLTSASSMAIIAGVIVVLLASGLVYRGARLARLEAADNLVQFQTDMRRAQAQALDATIAGPAGLETTLDLCKRALRHYGVADDAHWQDLPQFTQLSPGQQAQTREDIGEILFIMAAVESLKADAAGQAAVRGEHIAKAIDFNRQAEACYTIGDTPGAVWQQRAAFERREGKEEASRQNRAQAAQRLPKTARDFGMAACMLMSQHRFRASLPLWQQASARDPQNVWAWYGLGHCYGQLAQSQQAVACYTACIALKPDYYGWYFNRGLLYLKQKDYAAAIADFDTALRLQADHVEARFNRAIALLGVDRTAEAIVDLERLIELGHDNARTRLLLAQARNRAGDRAGGERERVAAMDIAPTDDVGWVARAIARCKDDPAEALQDLDRALAYNAFSAAALESKANLLAERLGRTEVAAQVLDRASAIYPESGSLLAARGVLLARLDRNDAARHDAREALLLDPSAAISYQIAGIYALLSRKDPPALDRAIELLAVALRSGYGNDIIATDKDLDPIRDRPQFQQLVQAVRVLHPASTALRSH